MIPIMPPVRQLEVPALLLRRASESRPPAVGPEDYDVIGVDGEIVGRIVRVGAGSAGTSWMWSVATQRDGEGPVLGYEATRDAAMQAFAQSGAQLKGNVAGPTRDELRRLSHYCPMFAERIGKKTAGG
jgi:hypothetical protein